MSQDKTRRLEDRSELGVYFKRTDFDGRAFSEDTGWQQFQHEIRFHGDRYNANNPTARLLLIGPDHEVIEDINDPLPSAAEALAWIRGGDEALKRAVAEAVLIS